MISIKRSICLALTTAALVVGATATPALAVERFASPSGLTTGTCDTTATACTIHRAIELTAVDGDTVTILPGDYSVTGTAPGDQLVINDDVDVRGAPGEPRPRLTSSAAITAVVVDDPAATLKRLEIVHNPVSGTVLSSLSLRSGIAEQVVARENFAGANSIGCIVDDAPSGTVLRDSVCAGPSGGEGALLRATVPGTAAPLLRNVTAFAPGDGAAGIQTASTVASATLNVLATNVIASGGSPASGGADLRAFENGGTNTTTLQHSNYDTELEGAGASATDPGSGTNQTTTPVFSDAAAGDFRQLAASPTRNAGTSACCGEGAGDVDGDARIQEGTPDIGADEFTPPPPPPPPPPGDGDGGVDGGTGDLPGGDGDGSTPNAADTDPPDTAITKSPKDDLRAGDTAKVGFGSDEVGSAFECRVGKAAFKACRSPHKLKKLEKGKTKFQVRAIDAAGNEDPTPAKLRLDVADRKRR